MKEIIYYSEHYDGNIEPEIERKLVEQNFVRREVVLYHADSGIEKVFYLWTRTKKELLQLINYWNRVDIWMGDYIYYIKDEIEPEYWGW